MTDFPKTGLVNLDRFIEQTDYLRKAKESGAEYVLVPVGHALVVRSLLWNVEFYTRHKTMAESRLNHIRQILEMLVRDVS